MKKSILFSVAFLCFLATVSFAQEPKLFPEIEPIRTGMLKVSDIHTIYWEVCGNEAGIPVIVLHGGPGGTAGPEMRRFFDPGKFKVILFDQRGGGRSLPKAEWRENTTQLLIEDIVKLRKHLGVTRKAMLLGGSWGTTLAIAFAEAHPEMVSGMVLRGVFLGSKAEIDHFYHGGTQRYFPENFLRLKSIVPEPESLDYHRQLFEMTQSSDAKVREKAIKGWAYYEIRMAALSLTDEITEQIVQNYDMTAFSVLENHYMMNGCFFDDDQLMRNTDKIADIPTFIVNGRFDVICPPAAAYALAQKLTTVKLVLPAAGHSQNELPITNAILEGVEWVADRIDNQATR